MHLLFVTSIVPDGGASSGFEIANRAIVDALKAQGIQLTIVGFSWPGKVPEHPAETVVLGETDVRNDGASAGRKIGWLATALRRQLPFSCAKLRILETGVLESVLAKREPFHGFVLSGVTLAGAYEDVFTAKPYLYIAHNVEHESALQSAAAAKSAIERIMFNREARLLKPLEERLCRNARFVFTLAEEDREPLGITSDERSHVLPLTTARELPPSCAPRSIECDLALIGTWTWAPNRIGLDWFVAEVVPHLPADFDIRVAGSVPADLAAAAPRVRFVGRVPDAAEFVRSGAVVPLASRAGTGVQLKTIETFELGLPSVATTSAVRGIAQVPANCTVADNPRDFAAALTAKVTKIRNGANLDLDGRVFHAGQRSRINQAIAFGLEKMGDRVA